MQTVDKHKIDVIWRESLTAPAGKARQWMDELCQWQPEVETYLFGADEHFSPSEERGILFMLGFLIWRTLSNGSPLAQIKDEMLEKQQQINARSFYEIDASTKHVFFDAAIRLVQPHNQRPLLEFVIEILREYIADHHVIPDANLRLAMVHLKTVADCLDQ